MIERMVHADDSRADFAARLKKALALAGMSGRGEGARLAKIASVTPKAASKWLNGEARPSHDKLCAIARRLRVREEWLEYGRGAMTIQSIGDTISSGPRVGDMVREGKMGEAALEPSNIAPADQPARYYRYPVISRMQAGTWTECVTPYAPGAEPHEETTGYRAQGKAFWLEVQGDSMTAPPGARPSVPEGSLVLFDSGLEPTPGKLVAAQLDDSNEATFKQLIEDGGRRYLRALNPAYPLIHINGNCRILGVAVEAKTRL